MILKHISDYLGHTGAIYCLCSYEQTFWAGDGNGHIVAWSLDNDIGQVIGLLSCPVYSLAYVNHKSLLIAGDMHGHIYWIDVQSKEIKKRHIAHNKGVFQLLVDSSYLYSCGGDGALTKWTVDTMQPIETIVVSPVGLRSICKLSNDTIVVGDGRGHLINIQSETMTMVKDEKRHDSTIFSIALCPGDMIATGSRDATIKISNREGKMINDINAHWYTINCLKSIGEKLISVSRDKKIRVWNLPDTECLESIDFTKGGHIRSVNSIISLKDDTMLVTAGDDKVIKVWAKGN